MVWALCSSPSNGKGALNETCSEDEFVADEEHLKIGHPPPSRAKGNISRQDQPLEVDYTDCTPLYRKLEDGQWDAVTTFLESGVWPGHLFRDASSPVDQAKTYVTRHDAKHSNKLLWSQLPLQ